MCPTFVHTFDSSQIGVGLMFLQQFSGANATAFYGSSIFVDAGKSKYIFILLHTVERQYNEKYALMSIFGQIFQVVSGLLHWLLAGYLLLRCVFS